MDQPTHWRDMLSPSAHASQQRGGNNDTFTRPPAERDDNDGLMLDTAEYQPWVLQRGRSRPVALLDLRWYDPKASLWLGCAIAYPQLVAAEHVGTGMLSLDFGKRQFVLEGDGLDELVHRLQQYSVIAIQEYAPTIWPQRPAGPIVSRIKRVVVQ